MYLYICSVRYDGGLGRYFSSFSSLRPTSSTYVSALCVCLMCLPYVSALCVCRMCLSDMTEDLAATLLPFLALRLPFEFLSLAPAGVNIITTGATHTTPIYAQVLFFYIWIFLSVMILLNIFVGILMEGYEEAKNEGQAQADLYILYIYLFV